MPKCPKCKKEINHLRNYALMWRELRFKVRNRTPIHEPSGDLVLSQPLEEEYHCPECDALLFEAKPSKGVRLPKPVAAYGISFPGNPGSHAPTKLVEYVVNTTWWKNNYGDDLVEDEIDE